MLTEISLADFSSPTSDVMKTLTKVPSVLADSS